MNIKPSIVWLTGLSGAGKTTIAREIATALADVHHRTVILDGDELRKSLNADLGFSVEHRDEAVRRAACVAQLFASAGHVVVVAMITPKACQRSLAKRLVAPFPFLEVFIDASIEVVVQRDPKGHYSKALTGELKDFTGISSQYEKPTNPDVHIETEKCSQYSAARRILAQIAGGMSSHPQTAQLPA